LVSFLLVFPTKHRINSSSPHPCYISCPFHPPWLYHCNYIWRRVQVMKILIITLSHTGHNFAHFKYLDVVCVKERPLQNIIAAED
jgi:hypothetical protein